MPSSRSEPRSFEDLPRNLIPAAALGMTTVLIKTDSEWAQEHATGDHIHHVTEDLAKWLTEAAECITLERAAD